MCVIDCGMCAARGTGRHTTAVGPNIGDLGFDYALLIFEDGNPFITLGNGLFHTVFLQWAHSSVPHDARHVPNFQPATRVDACNLEKMAKKAPLSWANCTCTTVVDI